MAQIKPGIYRHYADKLYLVLGMTTHSETNEELVLYIPLYSPLVVPRKHQMVVRPAKMWEETVSLCQCGHSEDSHNYHDRDECTKLLANETTCSCPHWVFTKKIQRFTFVRDA